MKIELKHGAGGEETGKLIGSLFAKHFANEILNRMEDGAVLPRMQGNPVLTSDSFVVQPLFFPGGDIGRLAVCGTVNDLTCMGAKPLYLTASFILETGLELADLEKIIISMAATAKEAGVQIVAGDTKVIEGKGGLYINTAGVGERAEGVNVSAKNLQVGDQIICTGTLGDHHAVILSSRLGIATQAQSDCAPLNGMVAQLLQAGVTLHTVRDITRGGLATVANELADSSQVQIVLQEEALPMSEPVQGLCGILGLNPLTMGNEGKLFIAVPREQADLALQIIRNTTYGAKATLIGQVKEGRGVYMENQLGSCRKILPLQGEGLPRIC